MAMPRESAFLPTIKCSQCSAQVEISMMGEHICEGAGGDTCELDYVLYSESVSLTSCQYHHRWSQMKTLMLSMHWRRPLSLVASRFPSTPARPVCEAKCC